MATTVNAQSPQTVKAQQTEHQQPKRLSKAAIWRQNNPGGIGVIIDRRAVNR